MNIIEYLMSKAEAILREHMRMLWDEHIFWTRLKRAVVANRTRISVGQYYS